MKSTRLKSTRIDIKPDPVLLRYIDAIAKDHTGARTDAIIGMIRAHAETLGHMIDGELTDEGIKFIKNIERRKTIKCNKCGHWKNKAKYPTRGRICRKCLIEYQKERKKDDEKVS